MEFTLEELKLVQNGLAALASDYADPDAEELAQRVSEEIERRQAEEES